MTEVFRLPIDLEALADALAPLIAGRLATYGVPPETAVDDPYEPPANAPDDPWADETNQGYHDSQTRSAPQSNNGGSTPRSGTFTDPKGKKWTFGKHGAPTCEHNMPAAFVQGVSEKGKAWKAWACPLGYGDSWRDKCDLYTFTR